MLVTCTQDWTSWNSSCVPDVYCFAYFYGCRADLPKEGESRIHVSSRECCPHDPAPLMLTRLLYCHSSCVVGNKLVQDRE